MELLSPYTHRTSLIVNIPTRFGNYDTVIAQSPELGLEISVLHLQAESRVDRHAHTP